MRRNSVGIAFLPRVAGARQGKVGEDVKKHRFLSICFTLLLALGAAPIIAGDSQPGELATVPSFDVQRHMGKWEEFARFPNKFQEKCAGDSTAEYSSLQDGSIRVINRCRLASGELHEVEGAVRQVGGEGSSKLEVSFSPSWLSFIPAVWGDYWVIDIDPNYQMVAIGEPKREYLWIMTRGQPISTATYMGLLSRLMAKGYDTKRLVFSGPPARK